MSGPSDGPREGLHRLRPTLTTIMVPSPAGNLPLTEAPLVDVRRYLLLLLFRLFDVTILAGACVAASVPGLRQSGAHSLAQFLALRFSVRNFVLFAALLLLWHVIFSFFGLYRSRRRARRHAEDLAIIQATAACTLALLVVGSLFQVSLLGPVFLSVFWLASAAAAILSHHALRWMLGQIRRRGRNLRHILIVGTNQRARKFALEPRMIEVKGEEDYAGAFAAMEDVQGQPVILPAGAIFLRDRAAIAQALLERRIPSIAAFRENLQAGALISYGYDLMGLFYDIAGYVHQIARGAKPADMPIEQSPRFYMAVNLKTAASLGVSLTDVFIARANEVIE